MESKNPVFARSKEWKNGGYATFDAPSSAQRQAAPADASARTLQDWYQKPSATPAQSRRMTLDDVVVRTAALFAVPYAWDALRLGGAAYLAYLAWQCVRPGGQPIFAPRPMPREGSVRLFSVGVATAVLNPKVALFYVAVLPPFLDPERGNVFLQSAVLGAVQIAVATGFDAVLVWGAAGTAPTRAGPRRRSRHSGMR